jgi:hypothetical protein
MSEIELTSEEATPQTQLIDFEDAELIAMEPPPVGFALRVRGQVPCLNMVVRLVPVRYVRQPEYWAIQVLGYLQGGVCLPAVRDFDEALVQPPMGTQGIVVVGESKRLSIEKPL